MRVRVTDIDESGLHIVTHESPTWLVNVPEIIDGEESTHLTSRFDIDLWLNKVLKEVTVSGSVGFSIESPCSRCLKTVKLDLRPEVNLVLTPRDTAEGEDDDLNHATYVGEEVDIGDFLREQVAMSLPLKVVCSESCKGLCPDCGVNLNEKQCGCAGQKVDPRLEVLKNFKI